MRKLPLKYQYKLGSYLANSTSSHDFEQWLYAQAELEDHLPEEIYLELISYPFSDKYAKHEVGKLIAPFLNAGKIEEQRVHSILNDLITPTESYLEALDKANQMYNQGYGFFGAIGGGIGLMIDVGLDDSGEHIDRSPIEKRQFAIKNHPEVKREAHIIKSWLDSGKIAFLDEVDNWGDFEYEDRRSTEDKEHRSGHTKNDTISNSLLERIVKRIQEKLNPNH
jgi:hypothetical protein